MKKIIRVREERCTGCRVCEMICSLEKEGVFNPKKSRIKMFQERAKGLDVPSVCQLCDPAPCVNICPVDALKKDANGGTIVVDRETCIGEKCLKCILECPYGAITWDSLSESLVCCDLCGGDPECVKFCEPRALMFEKCDQVEAQQQRSDLEKLLRPILKV
jgi:Fe-S-cluster-containing hydrogenase component 2